MREQIAVAAATRDPTMKSTFLRFERGIAKATLVIACVLFAIASCIGLLQIGTRFLFKYPTPWARSPSASC